MLHFGNGMKRMFNAVVAAAPEAISGAGAREPNVAGLNVPEHVLWRVLYGGVGAGVLAAGTAWQSHVTVIHTMTTLRDDVNKMAGRQDHNEAKLEKRMNKHQRRLERRMDKFDSKLDKLEAKLDQLWLMIAVKGQATTAEPASPGADRSP